MYTIETAEQVSLILVVTYYATHLRNRMRIIWRHIRLKLIEVKKTEHRARSMAFVLLTFLLNACIEASPVLFYGLHLSHGLIS